MQRGTPCLLVFKVRKALWELKARPTTMVTHKSYRIARDTCEKKSHKQLNANLKATPLVIRKPNYASQYK